MDIEKYKKLRKNGYSPLAALEATKDIKATKKPTKKRATKKATKKPTKKRATKRATKRTTKRATKKPTKATRNHELAQRAFF